MTISGNCNPAEFRSAHSPEYSPFTQAGACPLLTGGLRGRPGGIQPQIAERKPDMFIHHPRSVQRHTHRLIRFAPACLPTYITWTGKLAKHAIRSTRDGIHIIPGECVLQSGLGSEEDQQCSPAPPLRLRANYPFTSNAPSLHVPHSAGVSQRKSFPIWAFTRVGRIEGGIVF